MSCEPCSNQVPCVPPTPQPFNLKGDKGFTPSWKVIADGPNRAVIQVTGWIGGDGDVPDITLPCYVGANGYVTNIALAVNVKDLFQGDKGWSPVLAIVNDGARRVFQVIDWVDGEGTKPTTGLYVGPTGLTNVIANAIDVRATSLAELEFNIYGVVTNREYTLIKRVRDVTTINTFYVKTLGIGTATLTFKINGTPITGLTNIDIDKTDKTFTATAANVLPAGGKLTVEVTNAFRMDEGLESSLYYTI